jgi:hypothetical protein
MPTIEMRLAAMVMRCVRRLIPRERNEWARAMTVESQYAAENSDALHYALGCLASAIKLRLSQLAVPVPHEIVIGTIAGSMFLAHAFIPNSRSWPWIWPLAAGIATAQSLSRKPLGSATRRAKAGLKAGAACGAVFLAGAAVILYLSASVHGEPSMAGRGGLVAYGSLGAVMLTALSAAAVPFHKRSRGRTTSNLMTNSRHSRSAGR